MADENPKLSNYQLLEGRNSGTFVITYCALCAQSSYGCNTF